MFTYRLAGKVSYCCRLDKIKKINLLDRFHFECRFHEKRQVSTETCRFSMISVPYRTDDIPCGYDICFADDIRFAYEGTDIISCLPKASISYGESRISYCVSNISFKFESDGV